MLWPSSSLCSFLASSAFSRLPSPCLPVFSSSPARRLSCHPPPSCAAVDRSLTSEFVAEDGRVFRFAAVVVECMKEGQSALAAWSHACALVGANPPTLAVAIVSRGTKSAISAVQELSHQFFVDCSPAVSGHQPLTDHRPDDVSSLSKQEGGLCDIHSKEHGNLDSGSHGLSRNESFRSTGTARSSFSQASCLPIDRTETNSPASSFSARESMMVVDELKRRSMAPLIGCVAVDQSKLSVTTRLVNSLISGRKHDLIWMDEFNGDGDGDGTVQGGIGDKNEGSSEAGNGGNSTSQGELKKNGREVVSDEEEMLINASQGYGENSMEASSKEDEDTFSDWEELCKEYDRLEGNYKNDDREGFPDEHCISELDLEVPVNGLSEGHLRQKLARFWNSIARPNRSSEWQACERGNNWKGRLNACDHHKAFLESVFNGGKENQKGQSGWLQSDMLGLDVKSVEWKAGRGGRGGSSQIEVEDNHRNKQMITEKFLSQREGEANILSEEVHQDDEEGRCCDKDTESYQLILCVGNMPGVKVVGFHTRTTGLPWLPNLTDAVTVNNPHMLLLGASGFNFPEFIERLAKMFPNACRAGAFLLPLYHDQNLRKGFKADYESGLLFYGSEHTTVGAVGLAISSDDASGGVPMDGFAEFVRVSLGYSPIKWHIFLDNAVCKNLFLPRNVPVEWLDSYRRAYQLDPYSVIRKANAKLYKSKTNSYTMVTRNVCNMDKLTMPKVDGNSCPSRSYEEVFASDLSANPAMGFLLHSRDTETSERIPIISVEKVLFPGFFISLHIDSPSDRFMVRYSLEHGKPFGISSLSANCLSDPVSCKDIVGTVVNMKVSLFDTDCRSYIIAHGVQRFRVLDRRIDVQPGSFGLHVGQVEFFDDMEYDTAGEREEIMELARQAVHLCQQILPSDVGMQDLGRCMHNPIVASFAVSHILPVPDQVKRRWLSMVDTRYRLKEQISFLSP